MTYPSVNTPSPIVEPEYQPTAVQLERAQALRSFNRLFIYLPLALLALTVVGLAVAMGWLTLFADTATEMRAREVVSGVADIIVILVTLPLTLVCALLPAAAIGLYVYDRGRERTRIASLQRLIWRGEAKIYPLVEKLLRLLPKVARPIIKINTTLAYFGVLWARFKRIVLGRHSR